MPPDPTSPTFEPTYVPADQDALVAQMRELIAARTPIVPVGGGTSLDYGGPTSAAAAGLSLSGLGRVVDYPARDMTITVEAGITLAELARTLAAEGQQLPLDVPEGEQATLGGVIATNCSGPRRYGHGTVRDYVIGIRAVDGHGTVFNAGGRVVKNVAGYDFCRLLVGSLGTLAVVTQVTLKVKPLPAATALVACDVTDWSEAETLLAALVDSKVTPTAIELLAGPVWNDDAALGPPLAETSARLVVDLEGTAEEVRWMTSQLQTEWKDLRARHVRAVSAQHAAELRGRLREFPADRQPALVTKAQVLPGATAALVDLCRRVDPASSVQAHAGNGIVITRFAEVPEGDAAAFLVRTLRPAVARCEGSVVVLSANGVELTSQAQWGPRDHVGRVLASVKRQFDPHGLLNPGRFPYESA